MGFPTIPGGGSGGGSGGVQDSLTGSSTTVAPSVRAVNEGLSNHAGASDPHPQYTTAAEAGALDTAAVAAHVAAVDPHPIYLTQAEADALYAAQGSGGVGITDHGLLTGLADDDHTQYHNNTRGDARYSLLGHTHSYEAAGAVAAHAAAANPHPTYLTQAEADALYEVIGGGTGTVVAENITDSTADGRTLLTSNLAAQKTALGVTQASQAQAEGLTDNATVVSPLRVAQEVPMVPPRVVASAATSLTLNAGNKATYANALIEFSSNSAVAVSLDAAFWPASVAFKQNGGGKVTVSVIGGAVLSGDTAETVAPGAMLALMPSATASNWTSVSDGEATRLWSKVDGLAVTRKHELRGKYTTLFHPDTTKFPFRQVIGNGVTYTAADIDAGSSLAGILERVDDSAFIGDGSSMAPSANRFSWKLIVDPAHVVSIGRPRTQILMERMTVGKKYRLEGWFRLHQPGGAGWCDLTAGYPRAGFINMTQTDGSEYGANQDGGGTNGPFTMSIEGSKIFCAVRTIDAEQGSDDAGGYFNWGDGDTYDGRYRRGKPFVPVGTGYNHVSVEVLLDHRRKRDGGIGSIKVRFNGETYLDYEGPSIYGVAANTLAITQPHFRSGFYEVSGGNLAGGTLCSTVASCSIQRAIFWNGLNLQEVS